jgi:hypothetical protein
LTNYAYDALDRLIEKEAPDGRSIALDYALGAVAARHAPDHPGL